MPKTKAEDRLSKNTMIIYKIFQENPSKQYSINDLVEITCKFDTKMSERTIYRTVERLVNSRKIFSNDIIEGHRQYKLCNTGYFDLTCKNCGSKVSIEISNHDALAKEIYARYKFDVLGYSAECTDICKTLCMKNEHTS